MTALYIVIAVVVGLALLVTFILAASELFKG